MAMSKIMLGMSLITFPAKLDTAVQTQEPFKSLCVGQQGKPAHDALAITMPKTCAKCGPIADYQSLKKGLKSGDGFVVFEATEIAQAQQDTAIPKGEVSLVPVGADKFFGETAQGEKLYVVHVDAMAANQYALIVQAVEKHPDLAFIAQYMPRTRAGLYVARVRDGVLMLEERVRHENLKALPAPVGTPDPQFVTVLDSLIPTMVTEFDPVAYADKYAEQIKALAAAKSTTPGAAPAHAATPVATPSNADLLSKLQALATQSKGAAA